MDICAFCYVFSFGLSLVKKVGCNWIEVERARDYGFNFQGMQSS